METITSTQIELIMEDEVHNIPMSEKMQTCVSSLSVNDSEQNKGSDYAMNKETGVIEFQSPLSAGDVLRTEFVLHPKHDHITILEEGKIYRKTGSLYRKYGIVPYLQKDQIYHPIFVIDGEEISWDFSTELSVCFTTIKAIKQDIGEFIEGFTDYYILSEIYKNSLQLITILDEAAADDITNVTYEKKSNGDIVLSSNIGNNWVRFLTELDLMWARYYGISYRYGSEKKQVGDLSVEKTTKLPYIDQLLKRLKEQFKTEDDIIRGLSYVGTPVKGKTTYPYPVERTVTW